MPTETSAWVQTPTAETGIDLEPGDLVGLEVTFWHVWEGAVGALLAGWVEEFNASNPYGFEVEAHFQRDIADAMRSALDEGGRPHIAIGSPFLASTWDRESSTLVGLDDYFVDPQYGLPENRQGDFFSLAMESGRVNGKQVVLPMYRNAEVLFYNQTFAEELGFEAAPEDLLSFREHACAGAAFYREDQDLDNDFQGGLMLTSEPAALLSWIYAFGGNLAPDFKDGVYALDSEEVIEAFTFLRQLLDDGCAWFPESRFSNDEFSRRQGLFLQSSLAGYHHQKESQNTTGSRDEWILIPYPQAIRGQSSLTTTTGLVVFLSSPQHQLAAWLFAQWLVDTERQVQWSLETGYYPVRQSAREMVIAALDVDDPWRAVPTLMAKEIPLPAVASWPVVRWALGDTAHVLYAPLITLDDIPSIAMELDLLAEEIDGFYR